MKKLITFILYISTITSSVVSYGETTDYETMVIINDLKTFLNNNQLISMVETTGDGSIYANWYPSSNNNNTGVNGEGELGFSLTEPYSSRVKVKGLFENGNLISNAELTVEARKCYQKGLILCKKKEETETHLNITSSTDIKNTVIKTLDKLVSVMDSNAAGRSSSPPNNFSGSAPSNTSFCGANDVCHQLIKFKDSGAAIIKCTKGMYEGEEKCLSYDKESGKYADDCGFSSIAAHNYTLDEAAHHACD